MRSLLCLFAITVAVYLHEPARGNRTTEAKAIAALEHELDRATAADEFSGTVIVAKQGAPIFAKAYGRADRERDIANTLDTSFNVGSINKMFTAVAIIRLVQDGRLAVTDTVGKHIPDYPNRAIADGVTIHHLLTHTGGTGDIFERDYDDYRLKLRTHDDYLKHFGERAPRRAPGKRFEYSNYGFVLLGAILERVTGKPYYDAVAELVYAPAGMTSTSAPIHDEPIGAVGYTRSRRGELGTNLGFLPYRGTAAGGGWSTTGDFLRFANALVRNELLDAEHTKLLTTGKVNTGRGFKYAYGIGVIQIDGVRCIGHSGGFPGVNGDLLVCENGYTIATLANLDPPAASVIARFIATRLPK
jgi:D-alanyl-D-alanine carboxypeptidase